jgi:aryl-alcohol dehydrogenase-like predicted oxidoreductase
MIGPGWVTGRATPEGTKRFAGRFPDRPGHFRTPDRLGLSSLALGTRAGEPGGADDLLYRSAVPVLLEGGVNLFATALSDRLQTSERCLGAALGRAVREGRAARDEIVVISRGGYLTPDADALAIHPNPRRYLVETYVETGLVDPARVAHGVHCLDGRFLRDQIERSRRNLGLATLDGFLIEEPELHLGECGPDAFRARLCSAFEALEGAVADGAIAAYGVCTWEGFLRPHSDRGHLAILDVFEWALEVGGGDHHLRYVQLPYNLAMAEAFRLDSQIGPNGHSDAVLSTLQGTGTAVLASAPMAHGRVLGRLPRSVALAFPGATSDALRCLQFVRSTPGIASAVVGMRRPEHVEENLRVTSLPPAGHETIEELFAAATKRGAAS